MIQKNCCICNKVFGVKTNRTQYCSVKCKNAFNQSYAKQHARGVKRKKEFVNKCGGACSICGYNKNLSVLSFHHTDPSVKEFQLSTREMSNHSIEVLTKEFEKCVLVCANCHLEIHHPELNDWNKIGE